MTREQRLEDLLKVCLSENESNVLSKGLVSTLTLRTTNDIERELEQPRSTFGDASHPDEEAYIASNLFAHIDKMPNNGDWHGTLKQWASANHNNMKPNGCSCEHMLDGGMLPRPKGLPTPLNFSPDCEIHGLAVNKAYEAKRDDNVDWRAGSDYYPKG